MHRETQVAQGSLLCTRTWFPGEKEKLSSSKKGNKMTGLQLGGLCWKACNQTPAKTESSADASASGSGYLLTSDAQPKNCKHLLK